MKKLKTEIYADGANIKEIFEANNNKKISGLTTNPSLMLNSGVLNYKAFAKEILCKVKKKSISFEITLDNENAAYSQAIEIASWGKNIFVKVPIVNSKGKTNLSLISNLSELNINLNITAIFTKQQLNSLFKIINKKTNYILSIFAGRIADTGIDPTPTIKYAVNKFKKFKKTKILWASTREVYNIYQANSIGCHIITASFDIIKKLKFYKYSLNKFSKETSATFFNDAKKIKF
jgi:transaldolase